MTIETEQDALLLMVDPVGDQAKPISTRALQQITSTKSRVLARNCVALFMSSEGEVSRLVDILPAKTGLIAYVKALIGHTLPAQYRFEPVQIPLDDFRTMILDAASFMRANKAAPPWWLTQTSLTEIKDTLASATTFKDLYRAIQFPKAAFDLELL